MKTLLWLLPLVIALVLPAAQAASSATLNLKDAEINTLISMVSEITGKNFIVDGRIKGKVTVISARPMSPAGVYETFLGVLQVNGWAAIPDGQAIKIVPEANARQDGGVRTSDGRGLPIDDVVTYVFTLENISASQLVPILRPLVPQWGHLAAYAPSNQLIISDRAANVVRLEKLIKQMDQSSDREIEVVKLEHAGATDVVRILTTLSQQDKTQDPTIKPAVVIADERSNSVLLGGDKAERQKLLDIIKRLDTPLTSDGTTQVMYLRYASAENLAPILEGYAQQVGQTDRAAGSAAPAAASGGGGGGSFDRTRIIADKDANALVITAPPKVMRQVRDVINQLDIQRKQVLVEAIIAEVSANKTSQLGIDWAVFNEDALAAASILNPTSTLPIIAAASGNSTSAAAALGSGAVFPGIVLGGGYNGSQGTRFGVLLKALQTDGDTNVLSTPTLVTIDNEEAKFTAAQEVPFLTGQFTNTSGGTTGSSINPFQTLERRDVGLTLAVTPQINEGGNITIKINLEASALAPNSTNPLSPTTTKRTVSNVVNVQDGQVIVIGGLIDEQLADQQNGIPFISKIPLIGRLFQFRSVTKQKRNLMVFIKPSILKKQSDGDYYTRRKYDSLRADQIYAAPGAVPLVGGKRPVLSPLEQLFEDRPKTAAVAPPPSPEQSTPPEPQPVPEPAPAAPEANPEPPPPEAQSTPAPAPAKTADTEPLSF